MTSQRFLPFTANNTHRYAYAALLALLVLACSATRPDTLAPTVAGFAGTYATKVSLTQNNCGAVTVMDNPTVVTHNASTGAVTLTHAGTTYAGTVKSDSSITTTSVSVNVGDGNSYAIAIAGRFGVSRLDAIATVDRTTTSSGATCRYLVQWAGVRS